MAMQYKPTKQKKEKPVKAPKAPKADKPMKIGGAVKMKTTKPAKAPKPPKAPKPEKVVAFKPGKVEKASNLEKTNVLKKPINPIVAVSVVVALIVVAVLVITVLLPAIEHKGQEIKNVIVSSTPDKTVYLIGEEANYDGLRITVTRKNGETFTVRANACQITGFDSLSEGYKTITVNYDGHMTTFSVKVEEPPRQTPALASIRLETLPKTEYKLGEWLDTTGGMIVREYVDGSTATITLVNSYVSGFGNIKAPGEYTLTVKYVEKGIVCRTTYQITVTE